MQTNAHNLALSSPWLNRLEINSLQVHLRGILAFYTIPRFDHPLALFLPDQVAGRQIYAGLAGVGIGFSVCCHVHPHQLCDDDAKGAKRGAPEAQQIADRWHMLKNLSETMQSFFLRKQPQIKAAMQEPESSPAALEEGPTLLPWYTGQSKRREEKSQQVHQERVQRYHQIHDLYAKQVDVANIARQVGLSRQGVYNYLHMQQLPERTRIRREGRPSLDAYKPYLVQRWNEGCRSAQQMYREIKAQGYAGSDTAVGRFIAPWRALKGKARSFKAVAPTPENDDPP
jgi:transposase